MPSTDLIPPHLPDDFPVGSTQLADWLGVQPRNVYAMVKRGDLPEPAVLGPRTKRWKLGAIRQALAAMDAKAARNGRKKK